MNLLKRITVFTIPVILLLALAWKLVYLLADVFPFNSDEAVVALMARHILQGARPIFFYGQAYMGSLDAWLVALGFAIFGEHVWVIRAVQSVLYLGVVFTTIRIGQRVFQSNAAAYLAALLLAIPTVNVMLYTTVSLGGYGEALLLGNLVLLTSFHLIGRLQAGNTQRLAGWFALWGLLAGLGLWANGLTLVYTFPAGVYVLWRVIGSRQPGLARKAPALVLAILGGALIGGLPLVIFAVQNGVSGLFGELVGGAVNVETVSWPLRFGSHLVNLILLGSTALFGLRPPWAVEWLVMPLLPVALIFWCAVLLSIARFFKQREPNRAEAFVLVGVMLVLTAAFLFTPFGVDPSGRYFLPLTVPLALFAGWMVHTQVPGRAARALLMLVILFYQGAGVWQAGQSQTRLTTQFYGPSIVDHSYDGELIAFLRANGETRGYANYWVTYPLAFASGEELIFTPALPYHNDLRYTPRDDRYEPYRVAVAQSPRVAYINTRIPEVDEALRANLARLGVTWEEQVIGDYRIYYNLSSAVRPDEMNIAAPDSIGLP